MCNTLNVFQRIGSVMSYRVDAVVIGAGVVGLAVARAFAQKGLETFVIERELSYGQGVSSRNSEVIHAGLYYRSDSLKAKLCLQGREMLYEYCESKGVDHKQLGKWVVASKPEQVKHLNAIYEQARVNGCAEVYTLDGERAREIEPELLAHQVLVSPRTGVVDSHGLMTALLGDFEQAGGCIVYNTPVVSVAPSSCGIQLELGGVEPSTLEAGLVVNSAGLGAVELAAHFESCPTACFAKGNYFSLTGKSPFSRLIYPIPGSGGLGVHLTLDLQGRAKFGPDVQWIEQPEYQVDVSRRSDFARAIQAYWPDCDESRLEPDYVGVRPKLGAREHFHDDFLVLGPESHGIKGLFHLLGIESPGLTCCLSLASFVARKVG